MDRNGESPADPENRPRQLDSQHPKAKRAVTPLEPDLNVLKKQPDMDDIFNAIKPLGRYQIMLTLLFLYALCPLAVNNGFMAFGGEPEFICNDGSGDTNFSTPAVPTTDCQVYYNCSPGNLTLIVDFYSVAHQWGLFCDKTYIANLLTSIQMAGDLVGALIIGYISDTYGRKWTLVIVMAVQMLLGGLSALSPNWPVFALFRFLIGCCAGAELVAGWVLIAESTTNRYRYLIRAVASFTIASFDQIAVAYLTQDWKWYAVFGNVQGVPLIALLILFTKESPRWLVQRGRTEEAEVILRKIASINGTSSALSDKLEFQVPEHQEKPRPWHLFRTNPLRLYTLVSILTWFIVSAIFYGMYFNISFLPGNIYVSMIIMSILGVCGELPTAIYDAYNPKMNRKLVLIIAFTLCVAGNISVAIVLACVSSDSFAYYDIVVSIESVIGQVSSSVAFDQAYLYSVELFPTMLRSTAGSLCSMGARLGAIIGPQILDLRDVWAATPYVCFAILSFIGVCFDAAYLPNTKQLHLPEVIGTHSSA